MSIPFTTAQDYLQTEALSVISLNTVINLADTPDQDDVFFETNHKALTKKSIYGVSPAQRIRYYPILNKVSNIVARNLQYLNNARNSPNPDCKLYINRLLRCLVCETDVLRICKDMKIVKITPIFLHILDYAYSFDHMVTLYMNASLHFRRMDIHLEDVEQHSLVIYYTVPFMKLFEAYEYDAALMYYWNNSQPEQRMARRSQEVSSPMMKYIREEKFKGKKTLQEDLEEIEPELAKSLRFIQENPITEDLELPFTYEFPILDIRNTIELTEKGADTLLNDSNKEQYIDLLMKAKLNSEINSQVEAFRDGLFQIVPRYLIANFLPYELEILVCGQTEISLEDLKQSIQYRNCSSQDLLIQWFWEILGDFTQQERVHLLMFITGSASIPYRGIKEFKITIIKTNTSPEFLPVAHTCFSELELPHYRSKESLEAKLKFVITEGKEGFYIA